ncbi:SPJ_0845 family protein [Lactobacillus sp. PV034]|nr:SPJ_0845 family protein [Lactobacillus sp. PV034]
MGLTFKRNDDLEKMLDKFAIMPDEDKDKAKKKPTDKKEKSENKN